MPSSLFDRDLDRNAANFAPLSPVPFLERTASIDPGKTAIIHGPLERSYGDFHARCRRLGAALKARGIGPGDAVAVLAPNTPMALEAHFGVPMAGAVLNALNVRLDAAGVAFILEHGGAKLLLCDSEFRGVALKALAMIEPKPILVSVFDTLGPKVEPFGQVDYEELLAEGEDGFAGLLPKDEWQAISLNYTSGTTGNPKGVVYHHRGAALNAIGNAIAFGLSARTVYLWTLPMFHCNGWSYPWAVTLAGGTHVCLRRIDAGEVFRLIEQHGVTHLCGAPIVLTMLIHAPDAAKRRFAHRVEVATGGAAPPSAVIAGMAAMGFRVTHLYGLTETYGPATLCAWQEAWDGLAAPEQALRIARQGVNYPTMEALRVADPATGKEVPADGSTIGELQLRGNTVMKGYLKNPSATAEALGSGWLRTGDLAVRHQDGYVEIKDRAKDIIISGGENISSLEVEEVLYRHPSVMEAAVVARPDAHWGESPCAFISLKAGAGETTHESIIGWCRTEMARYKVPRTVVFGELPKTSTGKIQKYLLREQAKAMGARAHDDESDEWTSASRA
ncbi:MAG: acyl-CoA synthetase [Proteobacteria bacterium]|nr:acyl-CoA synthetase [Pseudomonadota bacterium]MBI3498839.1 acyl-CoA synthetase [Pseudomonadota bacterium]